jgi:hypothetical protein
MTDHCAAIKSNVVEEYLIIRNQARDIFVTKN